MLLIYLLGFVMIKSLTCATGYSLALLNSLPLIFVVPTAVLASCNLPFNFQITRAQQKRAKDSDNVGSNSVHMA